MNRENKRKKFKTGYYKNNQCEEVFECKVCGRLVVPEFAGTEHRNHCPNCLSSLHVDNEPGIAKVIAGVIWTLSLFGFVKMVNGQFCIAVDVAGK